MIQCLDDNYCYERWLGTRQHFIFKFCRNVLAQLEYMCASWTCRHCAFSMRQGLVRGSVRQETSLVDSMAGEPLDLNELVIRRE